MRMYVQRGDFAIWQRQMALKSAQILIQTTIPKLDWGNQQDYNQGKAAEIPSVKKQLPYPIAMNDQSKEVGIGSPHIFEISLAGSTKTTRPLDLL